MPPTVAVTANTTLRITTSRGEDVTRMAAAAGVISSASTSRAPTIWMESATLTPSSSMNPRASARTGTPRADGDVGVDAGEGQRPPDGHQGDHHHDGGHRQHLQLDGVRPRRSGR